jgi:hypothetical protein
MPDSLTPDVVLARLREGRLEALVGSIEWAQFECKKSPYQLDRTDSKFELAKDVAAMANATGGVILIGAATELIPSGQSEVVSEIRGFSEDLVDIRQLTAILGEWLFPPPRDLRVAWYSSEHDATRGVVAIEIQKAPPNLAPVLVAKTLNDTGAVRGTFFGVFERWRDGVAPLDVAQLHTLIRNGKGSDLIIERLDGIQASLDAPRDTSPRPATTAVTPVENNITQGNPRINLWDSIASQPPPYEQEDLEAIGLNSLPAYVLTGHALAPVSATDFFASKQSAFAALVRNPPTLRYGGFDIDGGANLRIHAGRSWMSMDPGSHRLLQITKTGSAMFAAPADASFLCWGRQQSETRPRINPIVLIESIYLFVELLKRLQELMEPQRAPYRVAVKLDRIRGPNQVLTLAPGIVHQLWGLIASPQEAPAPTFADSVGWASGLIDPETFAYDCVAPVYEWFGIPHDEIPYVREQNGRKVIDAAQVRVL